MIGKVSTDAKFLMMTTLIVFALGAKTFMSLTEPDELPAAAVASTGGAVKTGRSPSSIPTSKEVKPRWDRFAQHDLSCAKKATGSVVSIHGNFVQIQGRNCIKGFKSTSLEIINLKNGFTASIFESGPNRYQTDLIQLEQGENDIAIRYRERSGTVVEEVVRVNSTRI